MFNILFNLSLGIIGGIISSIIVSRIFMIQGNYHEQINSFNLLIRKLGYIDGIFWGIRAVLEVSYDTDEKIKNEMIQKGYKTKNEYYAAHPDDDWITKDNLLNDLLNEIKKIAKSTKDEFLFSNITETNLTILLSKYRDYINSVLSIKKPSFSTIHDLESQSKLITHEFEMYQKKSNKILIQMVLKDKLMIALYIFVILIMLLTIISYLLNW